MRHRSKNATHREKLINNFKFSSLNAILERSRTQVKLALQPNRSATKQIKMLQNPT